ncbi:MAG: glycoside hydrolase family protein [Oscillatoriales cyanobacterium RM2_1_1]|nr:glycoside hydrolase family protein [Oscillatoriales cyanobacterium SM2_3_0]NJO45281.1 glycoside hydrolase family protein [Oscillatoriales cyanobacterium RM2_1_1]
MNRAAKSQDQRLDLPPIPTTKLVGSDLWQTWQPPPLVSPVPKSKKPRFRYRQVWKRLAQLAYVVLSGVTVLGLKHSYAEYFQSEQPTREISARLIDQTIEQKWPPLVMQGGDPYIRALMRTISASESNYRNPYHVLYGGKYIADLSHHPDRCAIIERGPNKGVCTTAAGRYQILTPTWEKLSERYHPKPTQALSEEPHSFESEYQDVVIYRWLLDKSFWDADIPQMLRRGRIDDVLDLLSGTWTSLGYGIEDNLMTDQLPELYERILHNELNYEGNSYWLAE